MNSLKTTPQKRLKIRLSYAIGFILPLVLFSQLAFSETRSCESFFETPGTEVAIVDSSQGTLAPVSGATPLLPATVDVSHVNIETSHEGFQNREKFIKWTDQMMQGKLAGLDTQTREAYTGLFGKGGLFLNKDSTWFILANMSRNSMEEIRELNKKGDTLESDLVLAIIEEVYSGLSAMLNYENSGVLREFARVHNLKHVQSKKLWKRFQKFKEGVSRAKESNGEDFSAEETIKSLIGLAILQNILELDILDEKALSFAERRYLFESAGKYINIPLTPENASDFHEPAYRWSGYYARNMGNGSEVATYNVAFSILTTAVDFFVFPGLGAGSLAIFQYFHKHSAFNWAIAAPARRRVADKRIQGRARLLEEKLNRGNLVTLPGSMGEENSLMDPTQLGTPTEYKFNRESFLANYERVKEDPEELKRLIQITLNQFSLSYQEIIFQSMLNDDDFFNAWGKLERLKQSESLQFEEIKEIHRIFNQASNYYWRLRTLFKNIQEKLEEFRLTVEDIVNLEDKNLLLRLIDEKISKIKEQKDEFAADANHLTEIATSVLDLNRQRLAELLEERTHLSSRIKVTEEPAQIEGPKHYKVGLVKSTSNVSYHSFAQDTSKLPAGSRGTVEVYKSPRIEGYPIIVGVSGQADLGLCKQLIKQTSVGGTHHGVLGKTHLDSYTGEVARVIGFNRWTKKVKISIERVENSTEVVDTLDCY